MSLSLKKVLYQLLLQAQYTLIMKSWLKNPHFYVVYWGLFVFNNKSVLKTICSLVYSQYSFHSLILSSWITFSLLDWSVAWNANLRFVYFAYLFEYFYWNKLSNFIRKSASLLLSLKLTSWRICSRFIMTILSSVMRFYAGFFFFRHAIIDN